MTHTYTIEITPVDNKTSWKGKLLEDGKVIKESNSEVLTEVVNELEFELNKKSSG